MSVTVHLKLTEWSEQLLEGVYLKDVAERKSLKS